MTVCLRLILVVAAATSVAAQPSFQIGEIAYAPSLARFVIGSDDAFLALDRDGFVTRVTQDGAILDPGGRYLFAGTAFSARSATSAVGLIVESCVAFGCNQTVAVTMDGRPAWTVKDVGGTVVYNGTNFVVVTESNESFRTTFIDRAGVILRTLDVPVGRQLWSPVAVAPLRDGLIIAWTGQIASGEVLSAVRVDSAGHVGSPVVLESAVTRSLSGNGFPLSIASSGDDALIVWKRSPFGIGAALLDSEGNVESSGALTESDEALALALAWDGARYRLAWQVRTNAVNHVFVVDVNSETLSLDGAAIEYGEGDATNPQIAVSGNQLLVSFATEALASVITPSGVTVARFLPISEPAAGLTKSAPKSIFTRSRSEFSPAISWSGDRYVVVWGRPGPDSRVTLVGREFRPDGTPLGPIVPLATVSPNSMWHVGVASVDEFALVTWSEGGHLRALRVGRGLMALDEPVTLGNVPSACCARSFDLATSGSDFAVTWIDAFKLYGRLIEADSPLTFQTPITIVENARLRRVELEWSGDSYAVVFKRDNGVDPCGAITGSNCPGQDAYVADFGLSGVTPPRRIAIDVSTDSSDGVLARARTGVVYFWCSRYSWDGCHADFLALGYFSEAKRVDLSWLVASNPGAALPSLNAVWTGQTYIGFATNGRFHFDEDGHLLKPPFSSPGAKVVAASSGDGRGMAVFDSGGVIQGAIVGVPSRRRSVGSRE